MFHPIVNLILVLVVIIFLINRKIQLGLVMVAGALLLGLLFKVTWSNQLLTIQRAVLSPVFLQLGIALNIIMFLEHVLRTKGYLQKTLTALRVLIPDSRINITILPAFLGLLPSPGEAMFSAPLVAEAGKDLVMDAETKSIVNYWYRHVWEYFIPLYPGIILAAKILAVPISRISLILIGFFFLATVIGYLFFIRPIKKITSETETQLKTKTIRRALSDLFAGIWPVILIVVTVLFFGTDVGLTVSIVLIFLLIINKYRFKDIKTLWQESFKISLIFLIAGILLFKEMMVSSGLVEWLPRYFRMIGIPDIIVVALLTFLVALAVGISQGYIGTTFPLLTVIIGTGASLRPGMLILAFIAGFVGIMLSPLHLCFVLTVDYFKANFGVVWKRIVIPELLLLAAAFICALLWK